MVLTSFSQKVQLFYLCFSIKLVIYLYCINVNTHSVMSNFLLGTRLVVSLRGDEPREELEFLKSSDATLILHNLPYSEEKISRVHAARRYYYIWFFKIF